MFSCYNLSTRLFGYEQWWCNILCVYCILYVTSMPMERMHGRMWAVTVTSFETDFHFHVKGAGMSLNTVLLPVPNAFYGFCLDSLVLCLHACYTLVCVFVCECRMGSRWAQETRCSCRTPPTKQQESMCVRWPSPPCRRCTPAASFTSSSKVGHQPCFSCNANKRF